MGSYTYYDYDVNGRLTRVANHQSDESVISTFDYTLDPVGNRIAMQINSGDTVYYEYDGIYQLVKEDRRESDNALVYINYFEYDLAGNRTHLHYVDSGTDDWTYYTYNIENQLTIEEKGGVATYYTYDAAGALINKVTGEDESTYDYTYEGQMDEFASGDDTAYYIYDADKKRVQAKRNGTVEKYALSGNDVVADYDGDDTVTATYNTPTLDSNLTKKVGESIYFYLADGLGSVRNILDSDELIKNTYDYLAFGAVHGSPTENIANRYRFTAREWESIPSLHFYRARMMNQAIGRFLSKDPLFDTNLYVYVKNRPIILRDSSGKSHWLWPLQHNFCRWDSNNADKVKWTYEGWEWWDQDPYSGEKVASNIPLGYGLSYTLGAAYLFCRFKAKVTDKFTCCPDQKNKKTCYNEFTAYFYKGGVDGTPGASGNLKEWKVLNFTIEWAIPIKIHGYDGIEIPVIKVGWIYQDNPEAPQNNFVMAIENSADTVCSQMAQSYTGFHVMDYEEKEHDDYPYEERGWWGAGECCPKNCKEL